MDTAAEGPPRRRRVRCPFCRTILIEPAGSPVFECSICSALLRAKGTPPDFQGQSWQSPLEANMSQGQEQLDNHESNAQISMNWNISHQEQIPVPVRNVSVLENETEQEVQLHNEVRNESTSNLDTTSDYVNKNGTAISEEGMDMEMQPSLDNVSEEDTSASKSNESQKERVLMDHTNIQGILSNGDGTVVLQSPLEDAQNCSTASSSTDEDVIVGKCEGMGISYKECGISAGGNDQIFKSEILSDNDCKKSTAVGKEGMGMEMQQPLDYVSEEGTSASKSGDSQEAHVPMDHINIQGISSNGDGRAVLQSPSEDAQNCSMASSSKGEDVFVRENEGMEGKNCKDCGSLADGNDWTFKSEIIKDNDCKKSITSGKEGMAIEMQQSLDYVSKDGTSASKTGESQEAQVLMDHINTQGISSNGDDKAVLQSPLENAQNNSMSSASKGEDVFFGDSEGMEGKNYKGCDTLADGNDQIFESEIIRDNDCKKSFAIGEEHTAMEMQQPLDYMSERGSLTGKNVESQEAHVLMDHIRIQGISSNEDSKAVLQSPLEDAQTCSMASSSKEDVFVGDCERSEGKNYKDCDTLADEHNQIFESEIISDNDCKKSTVIGEEGMGMEMQQPLDYLSEEGTSAGKSGESQETQVLMDHINIQGISSNGDDKAVLQSPLEDAQNHSMASSSKEGVFVSEFEGMERKNYKECDTVADGNDWIFESEIVRDNDCKKSTPISEEVMAMEMQQHLDYVDEEGSSASKSGGSQEAQLLMDDIYIQAISSNGNGKAVLHSALEDAQNCSMASSCEEENASVGDCEGMEGKNYKECDNLANGNDRIFVSEIIRNNACNESFAIGEEGMAMEMQQPLDYVSEEGSSASKRGESQGAQVLMDHINIQGISSSGNGKAVLQIPLEDAHNCSMACSSKEQDVFVGESEGMEGKKYKECETLADGNDQISESKIIRDNDWKKSTAIGKEGMAMEMQQPFDYASDKGTSASKNGEAQEAQMLMDHINTQRLSSNGDEKAGLQSPMEDAQNCSMSSASEDENVLVGECRGVEGKNHKEFDTLANGSDQTFESEKCELSFKYISTTVELNDQIAHRRQTYRLTKFSSEASVHESEVSGKPLYAEGLASSSDENSDESERYSSVSDSVSHDGSNSDFDFPAPLEENMLPGKLTDTFLQQKMPSPSDAPATPHQLEWQDVYYDNEEYTFQNSNSAIVSSAGVVGNVVSDVSTMAEQGYQQVDVDEGELHTPEEERMKRETVLRGRDDTAATFSESLHAQRENGCSGFGVLANTVGFVASEGGEKNVALNATAGTEEDSNGYQGTLSYQLNECKPRLSNGSCDKVSGSLEGYLSGAEYPLKREARCTLKDGNLNTSTLPGGREEETYLAVQENSQFIKSVANVSPKDSVVTSSSSDYEANAGANHSKIASLMISMQKVGGKSSDGFHLQHDMLGLRHPSEATQMRNVEGELSSKHTSQVQRSIYNQGVDMSRAAGTLKGSSKTRQKLVQADSELADGQGPLPQKHNCQADLTNSGPVNEGRGFSPASSQPFGFNNYYNGSNVSAWAVPSASMAYSYQVPFHPLMLPVAMQGHACGHFGCRSVFPVCMACVHHQHSHLPQPIPPCGFCFNQSLSMAHQQGHRELWNYHQIHHVQAPDQGVPAARCPPTHFSSQTAHMRDTATAKPLVSSARRPKHYPPLPRGSTAPYVICKGCDEILQVPTDLCLSDGVAQKLRCSACCKVSKFSVSKGIQETCNLGLQSSALESSISSLVQDTNKESRQLPVSNTNQSMESSYHQGQASGMYPKYQQGAITNSQHHIAIGVVPDGVNRRLHHSSEDEIIYQTQCRQDEADCEITAAITEHSSQDEFFFRSLCRQCEFDSSRYWFKASSSAIGAVNCSDEGLIVGNDLSLQPSVDEKEEGLNFGAPRMSDGESLSPESRKRPSESKQRFQLLEQNRYRKGSFEVGESSWMNEFKQSDTALEKMSSTSLLALINQESTKFEINMEQRVSFEETRSALWSTATNSPMYDAGTDQRPNADIHRPRNLTAQHFVKKGPRYIADMLRRSLKDFHR